MAAGTILGGGWWVFVIVGLVPSVAGALDLCLVNVLLGQPLRGQVVRAR